MLWITKAYKRIDPRENTHQIDAPRDIRMHPFKNITILENLKVWYPIALQYRVSYPQEYRKTPTIAAMQASIQNLLSIIVETANGSLQIRKIR